MNIHLSGALVAGLVLTAGAARAVTPDCAGWDAAFFEIDGLEVVRSERISKGADLGGRAGVAPADYCSVVGRIGHHTGIDGMDYAITFNLSLPDTWNGDFVHQFNGGIDGVNVPATGPLLSGDRTQTALGRGYAVVSSDAGHDGGAVRDAGFAGASRFGFDPVARRDYGYGAVAKLHPVALAMVERAYGTAPGRVYGVGGSNGGRHAMVAAARMPEAFDGLLIGYPAFSLPQSAIQRATDAKAFAAVNGDIRKSFSQDDMNVLSQGILDACDALDGLADGLVQDTEACQTTFDITALQCTAGQNAGCLSPAQVTALAVSQAGTTTSAGQVIYPPGFWDPGMNSRNWRVFRVESGDERGKLYPTFVTRGAAVLPQMFATPPILSDGTPEGQLQFLLDFDVDRDSALIWATNDAFPESAITMVTPPGADNPVMQEARDAGMKIILIHGAADPIFSLGDTIGWYRKLDANNGDDAEAFVRLFAVPGMPHGAGGPSPDDFDFFSPLVDWVENGIAPEVVVAGVTEGNREGQAALGDVTRKLCLYPAVARYTGSDPSSADSFTCQ